MGTPILIIGKSGSGKSASLRNFAKDEVGIINVLGKPLPFQNSLKCFTTDSYETVTKLITNSKTNTIVIDDVGYLLTNMFMKGHSSTGSGNAVFSFYNEIADRFWNLIQHVVKQLPSEKNVYFLMHEEQNEFGHIKPKTIGKLLDEKVCLEGMFTIVLRAVISEGKHIFCTKSNGLDVAKTPIGMFESSEIDNDLKFVDETIRNYYGGANNE